MEQSPDKTENSAGEGSQGKEPLRTTTNLEYGDWLLVHKPVSRRQNKSKPINVEGQETKNTFNVLAENGGPTEERGIFGQSTNPFVEKISLEDHNHLITLPDAEEIKRVIFSLSPHKALGPDGCQAFFYRHMWDIVGDSVSKFIRHSFAQGTFGEGIGDTFICLIPKENNPDTITKFRPIALCNVLYNPLRDYWLRNPAIMDVYESAPLPPPNEHPPFSIMDLLYVVLVFVIVLAGVAVIIFIWEPIRDTLVDRQILRSETTSCIGKFLAASLIPILGAIMSTQFEEMYGFWSATGAAGIVLSTMMLLGATEADYGLADAFLAVSLAVLVTLKDGHSIIWKCIATTTIPASRHLLPLVKDHWMYLLITEAKPTRAQVLGTSHPEEEGDGVPLLDLPHSFQGVQNLVDEEFQGITHLRTSLHKKIANVRHEFIKLSGSENKMEALLQVLEPSLAKGNRMMVFCNTLNSSRVVDYFLNENQISTLNYHREVRAEQRVENLEMFKSNDGDCPTLVCTDLAARGLDLDVDHVVMFDFPSNSIDYLHRTGRTACMGAKGKVTSLVARKDVILATCIEEAMMKNESLESLSVYSIKRDKARSRVNEQKDRNAKMVRVSRL
ncbi:hypothetical protein BUALT_BualtUnG0006300 [Buddleja alternifolia]|uniref:Helicase C-terminal domain-containing protein n=1 Tax=Buddleja alternifolia TaxID=168488 RepID=A0AAV6W490_9LAMI|nr:hypothetical protein BUALT_BualtUnG0006300 [Buddleja alternifolia]